MYINWLYNRNTVKQRWKQVILQQIHEHCYFKFIGGALSYHHTGCHLLCNHACRDIYTSLRCFRTRHKHCIDADQSYTRPSLVEVNSHILIQISFSFTQKGVYRQLKKEKNGASNVKTKLENIRVKLWNLAFLRCCLLRSKGWLWFLSL